MLVFNTKVLFLKLSVMKISTRKFCKERAGISRGGLKKWENNPTQPRLRDLQNLADAAELPVYLLYANIINGEDTPAPSVEMLMETKGEKDVMLTLNITAIEMIIVEQKKSISDLCKDKKLHISRTTYNKWKKDPSWPRLKEVQRIADALNVNPEDLLIKLSYADE